MKYDKRVKRTDGSKWDTIFFIFIALFFLLFFGFICQGQIKSTYMSIRNANITISDIGKLTDIKKIFIYIYDKNGIMPSLLITLFILFIYLIEINDLNREFKELDYILNNTSARQCIIDDIVITKIIEKDSDNGNSNHFYFNFIIRDTITNKKYITSNKTHTINKSRYLFDSLSSQFEFNVYDYDNKDINIGDSAYYYIIDNSSFPLDKSENKIHLNDCKFTYKGNIFFKIDKKFYGDYLIYNINENNNLLTEDVDVFVGALEFKLNFLKENQSKFYKSRRKNCVFMTIILLIISLIIVNFTFLAK